MNDNMDEPNDGPEYIISKQVEQAPRPQHRFDNDNKCFGCGLFEADCESKFCAASSPVVRTQPTPYPQRCYACGNNYYGEKCFCGKDSPLPSAFHAKNGWYFERIENGDVRITRYGGMPTFNDVVIPENIWLTVVKLMGAQNV